MNDCCSEMDSGSGFFCLGESFGLVLISDISIVFAKSRKKHQQNHSKCKQTVNNRINALTNLAQVL